MSNKSAGLHNIAFIVIFIIGIVLGIATESELVSLIIIGGGGWLAYTLIETKEDLETEKSRRKYAEEELKEKDKE